MDDAFGKDGEGSSRCPVSRNCPSICMKRLQDSQVFRLRLDPGTSRYRLSQLAHNTNNMRIQDDIVSTS
jgi:hypothetical protein